MSNYEKAKEYLTSRDYKMEVKLDQGVFRHLSFKHKNSYDGSFQVTTWPMHLCISGDMGTFVFSRLEDMVDFFSGEGRPNPGYWSEKVQSQASNESGVKSFSSDKFRKAMEELQQEALEAGIGEGEVSEAFEDIEDYSHDEIEAVNFIRSLALTDFEVEDFDYSGLDGFNFHYLFACHAIQFACNEYLKGKTT